MKRVCIDANVVLRMLVGGEKAVVGQVKALFDRASAGQVMLVMPVVITFEVVYVLGKFYDTERAVIADTLASFIRRTGMAAQEVTTIEQSLAIFRDTSLDFADCYLLSHAELNDLQVATLDVALRKRLGVRAWKL